MEAALSMGLDEWAAERSSEILERVWRRMDAREPEPDGALPGVTREYWPEGDTATSAGIEGYGWGALTVYFLLRYLLGLREMAANSFMLVPALPAVLKRGGASYSVGPLAYGGGRVAVTYTVSAAAPDMVEVTLVLVGPWKRASVVDVLEWEKATPPEERERRQLATGAAGGAGEILLKWRGKWRQPFVVTVE
jgi:hypothetical protein